MHEITMVLRIIAFHINFMYIRLCIYAGITNGDTVAGSIVVYIIQEMGQHKVLSE